MTTTSSSAEATPDSTTTSTLRIESPRRLGSKRETAWSVMPWPWTTTTAYPSSCSCTAHQTTRHRATPAMSPISDRPSRRREGRFRGSRRHGARRSAAQLLLRAGLVDELATTITLLLVADIAGGDSVGYLLGSSHLTFLVNGHVAWVEEVMVNQARRKGRSNRRPSLRRHAVQDPNRRSRPTATGLARRRLWNRRR